MTLIEPLPLHYVSTVDKQGAIGNTLPLSDGEDPWNR